MMQQSWLDGRKQILSYLMEAERPSIHSFMSVSSKS